MSLCQSGLRMSKSMFLMLLMLSIRFSFLLNEPEIILRHLKKLNVSKLIVLIKSFSVGNGPSYYSVYAIIHHETFLGSGRINKKKKILRKNIQNTFQSISLFNHIVAHVSNGYFRERWK